MNDKSAERKCVRHCCVAQVSGLAFTFDFYQRLQSNRLASMANVELDSSDSGGSDFAGFDDEEIRRSIGETSRVIARAAVGVTVALAVSDSATDSSDSDATIVVITETVITRI